MGNQQVSKIDKVSRAKFIKHLLSDIKALEFMLENNMIESDVSRIGAEQEFCLVNKDWRPTKNATSILNAINDEHFTNEIARYNLEINLDPEKLETNCFSKVENQLKSLLGKASKAADTHNTKILLTGILPTITTQEVSLEYMTPSIRYELLNEAIKNVRKSDLEFHIRGVDELTVHHDSVLFEACNTSFQLHLQVSPNDFIASYNWAQAISGPVLGVSVNSPLLMGRELWSETRIALFQQSVDTRGSSYNLKNKQERVTFGDAWATGSIADIYKDEIAKHEILLTTNIKTNSLEELQKGNIPKLRALGLHNGTIYRWNRPCYGASKKSAHIRIENRYLPSGPTIIDEMANFAFWVGLMAARPSEFDDMPAVMNFRDAKNNFIKAARYGCDSIMHWKNKKISTKELVTKELLPIAYDGLRRYAINENDIERYLEVIANRATGKTGASWIVENHRELQKEMKPEQALVTLTKSMYENQQKQITVSQWPSAKGAKGTDHCVSHAKHLMSSQLFTVNENDLAEMATSIMKWKHIHHIPVVNDNGELSGLLTWNHMIKYFGEHAKNDQLNVADIMVKDVITVSPECGLDTVYEMLDRHQIGCLPVLKNKSLVGIITRNDIKASKNG